MARPRWLVRADRLPIRVRLTIAFAAVMAAVLVAAGIFLYSQFAADLDAQIDAALRAEATDLTALVKEGGAGAVTFSGEPLAQVYGAGGRLLASTRRATGVRLLAPAEARRATRRPRTIRRPPLPAGAARLPPAPPRDARPPRAPARARAPPGRPGPGAGRPPDGRRGRRPARPARPGARAAAH